MEDLGDRFMEIVISKIGNVIGTGIYFHRLTADIAVVVIPILGIPSLIIAYRKDIAVVIISIICCDKICRWNSNILRIKRYRLSTTNFLNYPTRFIINLTGISIAGCSEGSPLSGQTIEAVIKRSMSYFLCRLWYILQCR